MICSGDSPFIWSAFLCFDAASFASSALLRAILTKWSLRVIEMGLTLSTLAPRDSII